MFQDCANSLNAMGHGDPFCILVDLPYQNTSHEDCAQIWVRKSLYRLHQLNTSIEPTLASAAFNFSLALVKHASAFGKGIKGHRY